MNKSMKVAVMPKIGQIVMEQRPVPTPGPGEVLVKLKHVGVCGSDLHYYQHGKIGDFVVNFPFVLGHECAGIIEAVGEGVPTARIGEKVALEPGVTCGHCEHCKAGHYNLCPDVRFFATPPYDGTFCEYVTHPSDMSFTLPENVDTMAGALIEPLAVGMHAASLANASIGQTAVVLGSGCIGLMTMLALKARGVSTVYIADVIDKRLEKAKQLGADAVINAMKEDTVAAVMKLTGGRGVDIVIETAGNARTTQQTAELIAISGTIVLVGLAPDPKITYDFGAIMNKEITLRTIFRYRNLYPLSIAAVAAGAIDVKAVATDFFPFDRVAEAVEYNVNNKNEVVKAVIEM